MLEDIASSKYPNGMKAPRCGYGGDHIETSIIFPIKMDSLPDACKMKVMLDLQWALLRMAAISGAAGYPDFYDRLLRRPPLLARDMSIAWLKQCGSESEMDSPTEGRTVGGRGGGETKKLQNGC